MLQIFVLLFFFLFYSISISAPISSHVEPNKMDFHLHPQIQIPDWLKDAVIYEIFLRSFSNDGKLHDIESRLSYLKKLGITCVQLNSIFTLERKSSAQQLSKLNLIRDHFNIDLEFGTKDTFKQLVQEMKLNQIKIILEWNLLSVSALHPLVQEKPEWFIRQENKTFFNLEKPEVQNYLITIMEFWIKEFDIDGFYFTDTVQLNNDFLKQTQEKLTSIKKEFVLISNSTHPENIHFTHAIDDSSFLNIYKNLENFDSLSNKISDLLEKEKNNYSADALIYRSLENSTTPRASSSLENQFSPASVLLLTFPGIPAIYNGQEIASEIISNATSKNSINWKAQSKKNYDMLELYQKLIKIRQQNPALQRGQFFKLSAHPNTSILIFARTYRDNVILTAINFSNISQKYLFKIPGIFQNEQQKINLKPLFKGSHLKQIENEQVELELPAYGFQMWVRKQ